MKVKKFCFNMFGVNTYVVYDPESRQAAIIDPGMMSPDEQDEFDHFIKSNNLNPTRLIYTHLHLDHAFGNDFVTSRYGLKACAHGDDEPLGANLSGQARMFGIPLNLRPMQVDEKMKNGDKITIGNDYLEVKHIPGHSPGGIVLYAPKDGFVITGDVLFNGSIGRTDLPGGNHAALINGIKKVLLALPDDTVVYPGHGGPTTIGAERRSNPWLR